MSFFIELWESIFTPGPTPTILKATNATFAALQIVLAALLLATHSVHFVVLSVLSAGLWRSINWFAAELAVAKEAEDKEETEETNDDRAGSDSDTEVEEPQQRQRPQLQHQEQQQDVGQGLRQRRGDAASTVSTEDEWERVSETESGK